MGRTVPDTHKGHTLALLLGTIVVMAGKLAKVLVPVLGVGLSLVKIYEAYHASRAYR